MKKLVLGVVALGVMVNVAWAYYDVCQIERYRYAQCLENISPVNEQYCSVVDRNTLSSMISERVSQVKAKLEACEIRSRGMGY